MINNKSEPLNSHPFSELLVILPSCKLYQLLLKEMHCTLGGHLGAHKTSFSLLHYAQWLDFLHDIFAFICRYHICQWQKDLTSAPADLLQPIDNPTECLSVWSMEFITDLPLCGSFNGILTYMDKLTKWVKLIPVFVGEGWLTVSFVAHLFLNHVVYSFDIPTVVVHNPNPWFTSQLWTTTL